MSKIEPLSQSAQDYLEALLIRSQDQRVVRISDIAASLDVRLPSVVVALKGLAARGLVRHERYGYVELTQAGQKQAQVVYDRHRMLFRFLREILAVDARTAEADACKVEHNLSEKTVRQFVRYVEFVLGARKGELGCLPGFRQYSVTGKRRKCPYRKYRTVRIEAENA